ncbi:MULTISPECIES: endonuclease domain-containing protein [unclassified Brevundimonas]|uniref:endonuclease domain-containing protein n=1 Tax=unclassified Brevundimonas TaxID=2622653 RepID=UPI0025B8B4F6|nr:MULTISPECIES: DUF559 domain-containing protein [unclassified Brevundimonas]
MWQTPDRTKRARRQRQTLTHAEEIFWRLVRDRRLDNLKFRRQTPVGGVICDFACTEIRLVVELDGGVHKLHEAQAERDARLEQAGFMVLRSGNEAFLSDPNVLLGAIRARAVQMRMQPPHPSGSAAHLLPRGEKEK